MQKSQFIKGFSFWKTRHIWAEPALNTGCELFFKMKTNNFLIFIGSTHGFINDFAKQKEIIEKENPEFVLCEELEDLKLDSEEKFLEILKKKHFSEMTKFEEVEKLIKFCFNKNIKLRGIDFHNFGFDKNLQKKIKNKEEPTKEEEEKLNKIIALREKNHLSKILEYQKKSLKPLVIIIGCWHLREGSFLRGNLENYKIIAPCDNKGKILFGPKKGEKIKYCEITSNGAKIKN